jgi:hypothetical protein
MQTPLGLITRLTRPGRPGPAIGRCAVCQKDIAAGDASITIRGNVHVHRRCATYRMRQRSRLH